MTFSEDRTMSFERAAAALVEDIESATMVMAIIVKNDGFRLIFKGTD
jgi:hypothetical protein